MPRPSKTKGAKHWYGSPIKLDAFQKRRLCEDLLGLDFEDREEKKKATRVIVFIEFCLGSYHGDNGMRQHMDKEPTNAAYSAEISGLCKQTYDLLQDLATTSYRMHDLYDSYGYDLHTISHELAKFFDLSVRICNDIKGESRGAPRRKALVMLVNTLAAVFDENYNIAEINERELSEEDSADGREMSGRSIAQRDFITECLAMGKVDDVPNNVMGLIYDTNTPESERLYIKIIS